MTVIFRKHIALLLLGIFFFPIVFQPLHVLWHKAIEDDHHHMEHAVCYSITPNQHAHEKGEALAEKESVCPICAYEFSVNEIPNSVLFHSSALFVSDAITDAVISLYLQQVVYINSSRAPPVFF
jgi:hypothetical protein